MCREAFHNLMHSIRTLMQNAKDYMDMLDYSKTQGYERMAINTVYQIIRDSRKQL